MLQRQHSVADRQRRRPVGDNDAGAAAHQTVNLYLINGVKLTGEILAFDQFVILLSGSSQDHVYKRAVSTIQPVSQAAVKSLNRHEPTSSGQTGVAKTPTVVRVRPRRVIDKSLL